MQNIIRGLERLFRLLYFKVVILKHSQFQKHYFYLLTALNSCRSSPSEVITNTVSLVCLSIRGYQTNCYVDHIFCLIYNTLILLIQKVYMLIMCPLKFKVIQYDINATFLLTMLGNVKLKGGVRPSCTSVDKNENIFWVVFFSAQN